MSEKGKVVLISLKDIHPDENQPRKNFNPERLAELVSSIKLHGIINPIIVEKTKSGYLLVDGERRFRAATELELKQVPVIVVEEQDATKRLIQQFHLQEQHEGWTPVEKAHGVMRLSKALGLSIKDMGKLLSMSDRMIRSYMGFAELLEHKEFEKNEIPLTYAERIVHLRNFTRHTFEKTGKGEFSLEDEANLEKAIIKRIKMGDIRKPVDLTKIRDTIKTNPRNVYKVIKNTNVSTQKLFLESAAKASYHYRNIVTSTNWLTGHINALMELKGSDMFVGNHDDITRLRRLQDKIDELLGKNR
jgi:ParB/RepB/Spo0J family partition protein